MRQEDHRESKVSLDLTVGFCLKIKTKTKQCSPMSLLTQTFLDGNKDCSEYHKDAFVFLGLWILGSALMEEVLGIRDKLGFSAHDHHEKCQE